MPTALLSLLGPVRRVCAMATRAAQTRTVPSGPAKGTVLPVDVDTHINAILEFCSGAQVTLTCSFDVWDSELPRMELFTAPRVRCSSTKRTRSQARTCSAATR